VAAAYDKLVTPDDARITKFLDGIAFAKNQLIAQV
jgi:hypothetical protein